MFRGTSSQSGYCGPPQIRNLKRSLLLGWPCSRSVVARLACAVAVRCGAKAMTWGVPWGVPAGRQSTLRHHVTIAGVGVHSGLPATITLHPAEANTGV